MYIFYMIKLQFNNNKSEDTSSFNDSQEKKLSNTKNVFNPYEGNNEEEEKLDQNDEETKLKPKKKQKIKRKKTKKKTKKKKNK